MNPQIWNLFKGFETYHLIRQHGFDDDKNEYDYIEWRGPLGTYRLDLLDNNGNSILEGVANGGKWYVERDPNSNKPQIALLVRPRPEDDISAQYGHERKSDAALILCLQGACSLTASLSHLEDDVADRIYYYATDEGNDVHQALNEWPGQEIEEGVFEQHWAFILRAMDINDCPIKRNSSFDIICFKRDEPMNNYWLKKIKDLNPIIFWDINDLKEIWETAALEFRKRMLELQNIDQISIPWSKTKINYQSNAFATIGKADIKLSDIKSIKKVIEDSQALFLVDPCQFSKKTKKMFTEVIKDEMGIK